MRRALLIFGLIALALAALFWSGADAAVARWAAGWQREFQNGLAGALRALRARDPGAFAALMGLAFAYGVVHAAGPGHGKLLIGGYGLSARVPALRLSIVAMAASLGQAVTAIALVYGGMLLLGYTRAQLTGLAEGAMSMVSAVAIGLIGLWLLVRGARKLRGQIAHEHHGDDCGCGHAHAPSAEEVARAHGLRATLALIGAVAVRPCTGALLLLVLTWQMGIPAAGVAGTLAMALGTGAVTVAVAVMAAFAREGALGSAPGAAALTRVMPVMEITAGAAIALISLRMLGWA
ncbi:nickel/cobalt transporter [Roseovarius aquimarinus]|uniref:Nickel/cobalt efflux system n=1 Tax=Roseovarius aquimarinus TaxID=1229156 RepID=A0ABW7I435_9RHOB